MTDGRSRRARSCVVLGILAFTWGGAALGQEAPAQASPPATPPPATQPATQPVAAAPAAAAPPKAKASTASAASTAGPVGTTAPTAPAKPGAAVTTGAADGPPAPGAAEEPAPTNAFEILLADLERDKKELDDLTRRAAGAKGDERDLLLPQLEDVAERYHRRLGEAATAVMATPPPGDDAARVGAAKASIAGQLAGEERRIIAALDENQAGLKLVRQKLEKASADERLPLIEDRRAHVERAGHLLGALDANIQARKTLKETADQAVAGLKKRLGDGARFVDAELHSLADQLKRLKKGAEGALPAEQKTRQAEWTEQRSLLAELQKRQLALMDSYGLDTTRYRQDLIRTTGEVSEDILDAKVAKGLVTTLRDDALAWLKDNAVTIAFKVGSFLLILVGFVLLGRIARWLARRAVAGSTHLSGLASDFFVKMVGRVVVFAGFVVAAAQIGIEVGPVLAGLGIAGFVLGFALQDTLSNFASGMMIIMYRPFDVGDVVEAAGVMGTVNAMTLVSTSILTFDNQMLVVPNNKIWGGVIRNVTHQPTRRIDLEFAIGYADDVDHARSLLEDIVKDERVLAEPAAIVRLNQLGESAVKFIVRPWVKTEDYWDVYWAITSEVKRRFDLEGISFPFPQQDVHLHTAPPASQRERKSGARPTESKRPMESTRPSQSGPPLDAGRPSEFEGVG